jgi:hypothetical protein
MSTRTAKQLIYGTLYILIFLAICGGIYFLFIHPFVGASVAQCTPSTCTPTSTAAILASLVATFTTSPQHDTFLGQIVNSNPDFGAQLINYEVDLYDASDTILQSIPGQSFVYANQNKYLVIPNVVIAQPFDHAALNITSVSWLASSTLGAVPMVAQGQFALQNIQANSASTTVSVGGQLTNSGIGSFAQVMVVVLFKDVNGDPIGASQTELDNVTGGETVNFSVIYPNESTIDPALNEILIYAIR